MKTVNVKFKNFFQPKQKNMLKVKLPYVFLPHFELGYSEVRPEKIYSEQTVYVEKTKYLTYKIVVLSIK